MHQAVPDPASRASEPADGGLSLDAASQLDLHQVYSSQAFMDLAVEITNLGDDPNGADVIAEALRPGCLACVAQVVLKSKEPTRKDERGVIDAIIAARDRLGTALGRRLFFALGGEVDAAHESYRLPERAVEAICSGNLASHNWYETAVVGPAKHRAYANVKSMDLKRALGNPASRNRLVGPLSNLFGLLFDETHTSLSLRSLFTRVADTHALGNDDEIFNDQAAEVLLHALGECGTRLRMKLKTKDLQARLHKTFLNSADAALAALVAFDRDVRESNLAARSRKRERAEHDDDPPTDKRGGNNRPGEIQPGKQNAERFTSKNKTWYNTKAVGKKLNVDPRRCCLPVVLSYSRSSKTRARFCPRPGLPGHETHDSEQHQAIDGITADRDKIDSLLQPFRLR